MPRHETLDAFTVPGVTIVTASRVPALQLWTRHIQVTLSGLGLGLRYKPTLSL
jgi:hypothetical protein